eukprot:COSAG02_NODE_773_length_17343_cov_61.240373_13_plen_81_part_00
MTRVRLAIETEAVSQGSQVVISELVREAVDGGQGGHRAGMNFASSIAALGPKLHFEGPPPHTCILPRYPVVWGELPSLVS